ncbi:MAG: spore germination protein [Bacillota bacterium]|nr:spore germination protein [Bacillota bacterium]
MYFGPVTINLLALKINSVDHSAIVNMGPSQHIDVFVSYKRSQGVGEQNGDISPMLLNKSFVLDNDLNDSPTIKNSVL